MKIIELVPLILHVYLFTLIIQYDVETHIVLLAGPVLHPSSHVLENSTNIVSVILSTCKLFN